LRWRPPGGTRGDIEGERLGEAQGQLPGAARHRRGIVRVGRQSALLGDRYFERHFGLLLLQFGTEAAKVPASIRLRKRLVRFQSVKVIASLGLGSFLLG